MPRRKAEPKTEEPQENQEPVESDREPTPVENEEPAAEAAKESEAPAEPEPEAEEEEDVSGDVEITYNGLKSGKRPPAFCSVIIPDDKSVDVSDPKVVVTSGQTLSLALGRSTTVSAEAADWLKKHYWWDFS